MGTEFLPFLSSVPLQMPYLDVNCYLVRTFVFSLLMIGGHAGIYMYIR
jgi:hypothetical protein